MKATDLGKTYYPSTRDRRFAQLNKACKKLQKTGLQDKLKYLKIMGGISRLLESLSQETVAELLKDELMLPNLPAKRGYCDIHDNRPQRQQSKVLKRVRKCGICRQSGHVARQGKCPFGNARKYFIVSKTMHTS